MGLDGNMDHFDPKDFPEDDCFKQGGDLWRLLKEDKKALLIKNTGADMACVTDNVRYRHAAHCFLADPEYGERIAKVLELDFAKVKELSKLSHAELKKATASV